MENCLKSREEKSAAYERCLKRGEGLADRLAQIRHKKNCRERNPVPNCQGLPACVEKKATPVAETEETYRIKDLGLFSDEEGGAFPSGQTPRFESGKSVWIRYEVDVGERKGKLHWFEQEIKVVNTAGEMVLEDQQSFEHEAEMTSSYKLNSSFEIPKDFERGRYKLELIIKERYSHWQATHTLEFEVE